MLQWRCILEIHNFTGLDVKKETDAIGGVNRACVLLTLFAFIVSSILLVSAFVYVHQLNTEWMRGW